MKITDHHAKYYAHDLTLKNVKGVGRLSRALFDAQVDLNPHQIEAALFALQSPLSKGVILADEVGLGKTIEAGILLCQLWAERKRRLLIIAPASIRKQWALELEEKFSLPTLVLDARSYNEQKKSGNIRPFDSKQIVICSYQFANRYKEEIRSIPWDRTIIDESHKLRNAYRASNKLGQGIRWALEDRKKILLTATPLQNSLLELYGLTTIIDENIFGDPGSFRSKYMGIDADLPELKERLSGFCKRTLRRDVTEYVNYTNRRPITRPFNPTDDEQRFYDSVSKFLQRENSYAIPNQRRHLTLLILRKLLASSVEAIVGTLQTMKSRLLDLRDGNRVEDNLSVRLLEEAELEDELLDEFLEDLHPEKEEALPQIEIRLLTEEIQELEHLIALAKDLGTETKTKALLQALEVGFTRMQEMKAESKALIFTESRRTQERLKSFLEENGYAGNVVLFNGSNAGPEAKAIYDAWLAKNKDSGRATGSRLIDSRTALIEHFRDHAAILIATEAAAEGVNMQFCSLVVNYDLPWNPQRIEQRIGRCHRYGQKHDVVVVNFLNSRNHADQRVHQLLQDKFLLFDGIFGASDEVLGTIESGVDFEKRILAIYQTCRTPEEIEAAFTALRAELDESIKSRIADTQKTLFEHFDEDVHQRLKFELADTQSRLDAVGQRFWKLSQHIIADRACWDEAQHNFALAKPPSDTIAAGRYFLISKNKRSIELSPEDEHGHYLYRLSHPLGEWVLEQAKQKSLETAEIAFDLSKHPTRIAAIEALKGKSGYLCLSRLRIQSYEEEEYLLFSAFDHEGKSIDQETCEKLFQCGGSHSGIANFEPAIHERLNQEAKRHAEATISLSLESNSKHFRDACERIEKWAEDVIKSAEKALDNAKAEIRALRREVRLANTLEEQHEIQEKIRDAEKRKRRARNRINEVEDEVEEKRDQIITSLENKLSQKTELETLFTIRWRII